jgi:excisionase family DNA binding protein
MQDNDEYITPEEACDILGVSPRTLERYVKDGLLKKYRRRIGRNVFYKRSEVQGLLQIRPEDDVEDP